MLKTCQICGLVLLLAGSMRAADVPASPLAPDKEQGTIVLAPGLRLELVAAEPEITSPVAMAFGADGRLFVVEMRDYPNGPAPGEPPLGRIKVLTDRDGDGRFETATIFADKLLYANGLLPWKDGLIVTAAPNILWLRDTDGDGQCDVREILYEGFAVQNPQLRVSHPILGLDGWVYVANGLRGGQVVRHGVKDAKPVNLSGMDFRFNMLTGAHEAISGMGQYGNTFDDWGHRFVCDNRHHLRHVVLPAWAIQRNPFLAVTEIVEDVSELTVDPLAAKVGAGAPLFPLSRGWTTSNLHANRFTAACGVFVYRGSLLPAEHYGTAFTCDPTANLVHQEVLSPAGATFRSRPRTPGVEFLASPDEWFRPVSLAHGPDGALYIVDMYRAVIEHPEWMPAELQKRRDLDVGRDLGRLWRVVPAGEEPPKVAVTTRLHELPAPKLVELLAHPNAWQRETSERLILERQDKSVIEPLRGMLTNTNPQARVHAAWLLRSFGELRSPDIAGLLADTDPRVREQAVILVRESPEDAALLDLVQKLAEGPAPEVRSQAALILSARSDEKSLDLLTTIALNAGTDRWTRIAVASGAANHPGALFARVLAKAQQSASAVGSREVVQELATLVGSRNDATEVLQTLTGICALDEKAFDLQLAALTGLTQGLQRRGARLSVVVAGAPITQQPAQLPAVFERAVKVAQDEQANLDRRVESIALLSEAPWALAQGPLWAFAHRSPLQVVRTTAVRSIGLHNQPDIAQQLLAGWRTYTPPVRREVIEALFRQPDRLGLLLDALEAGQVQPVDLDAGRTRALVGSSNAAIRDRAKKLLEVVPSDRKAILEQYQPALAQQGDPARGKLVFTKICAACHRVGETGQDVGPSIADTRTKTLAQLLNDVLNPNQAIDNNFVAYVIETKSGRSVSGVIVTETANSITLKRAENLTDTVLRQDIEELVSTGQSLMPSNLEKTITVDEMRDLLVFLKNWRYLDGKTPLGK